MRRSKSEGFTLIEIMTAVVIVAILAAIAAPSYTHFIVRSKLTEGKNALKEFELKLERYYQNYHAYGAGGCGITLPATMYFTYRCEIVDDDQGYLLTASNRDAVGMGAAAGYEFTVNHRGVRTTTRFGGEGVAQPCWISRKSETC